MQRISSHCNWLCIFFAVENLAYKRDTWVNDKRHSWMGWKDGHSSYAVDGDEDTHLRRCAILDNYYVDYPVWMVDLGDRKTVRGVVIITWQGRGEGIRLSSAKGLLPHNHGFS